MANSLLVVPLQFSLLTEDQDQRQGQIKSLSTVFVLNEKHLNRVKIFKPIVAEIEHNFINALAKMGLRVKEFVSLMFFEFHGSHIEQLLNLV